jgi:hypothetical protein
MHITLIIKAGFMGFALCLGVLLLIFYAVGLLLKVPRRHFVRVFFLAAVVSFVVEYLYLHYKLPLGDAVQSPLVLVGSIGGWLGGILFGLTNIRRFLANTLR